MINLRIVRQTFDFDCGAKALQTVMEYYGVEVREDNLLKELKTDEEGTSVVHMTDVAKKMGFQVFAAENVSLEEVRHFVEGGYPVIVLVQAWAERYMTNENWKKDYEDGHYVVVIGFEGPIVIFEDPSSFHRTWLTEEEFLARWHDQDSRTGQKLEHFAMVLLGKKPAVRTPEHMD
ncbi:MAG: cysteine peptidase family C39 domain-containing protein [Candidatus Aminicenantales bacterium]